MAKIVFIPIYLNNKFDIVLWEEEDFYQKMGMKTKLSENTDNFENTADFIVNRFEERGWKALGERQNLTLDKLREIVELSY